LDFACKLTPKLAPKELQPWFNVTNPNINRHERVIFGHWASLQGHTGSTQFIATDTGYVWGNALTAIKIKNGKRYQIEA
jgi:bis(5'-nucleosyl)-tetraphosphatase (symmetrical)